MKGVFRRFLNFVFRELTRVFLTFVLIVSILVGSLVRPLTCEALEIGATVLTLAEVAGFVGSTMGILNTVTDGGVSSAFGHVKDTISEWWANNQGSGIYEDSEGNIIFGEGATQELYEALLSDSSIDARAISNFGGNKWTNALYYANSPYINSSFKAAVSTAISNYDNYLVCMGQYYTGGPYYSKVIIVNLSDVAYFVLSSSSNFLTVQFYNSSGVRIYCNYYCIYQSYSSSGFSSVDTSQSSRDFVRLYFNENYNSPGSYSYFLSDNVATSDFIMGDNLGFLNFPFLFDKGSLFFSNRSLIIGKDVASANQLYEGGGSQYIVSNYYNQLPSISKDVINNNNWENIYNSYVTNVQNNEENYITDGEIDYTKLREYMKLYSNVIAEEVRNGTTDIENKINYTNEWLDKIYRMLADIRNILNEGGSSDGTTVDLTAIENYLNSINTNTTSVLSALTRIENSLADELDQMELEYVLLNNIYTALQNIGSGGGGGSGGSPPQYDITDDPYKKWFDYLDDMPSSDLTAILSKYDVIEQLLKGVAPFCYIALLDTFVTSLDVEAVEPKFAVPVRMNNQMQVDEELNIDLTMFDDFIPVFQALVIILFTTMMIFLTFWLLPKLLEIFEL